MKFFLSICISIFVVLVHSNADCHPEIDNNNTQYIVGYRSLINEESKRATVVNVGNNIPVRIEGFRRGWFHLIGNKIFLGSIKDPKFGFNAVVFSLHQPGQMKAFDQREIDYCRKKVSKKNIKLLTDDKIDGDIWIYVTKNPKYLDDSDHNNVVDASYLYTFLSGCLAIKRNFHLDDFLEQCIMWTYSWPKHITYDLDKKGQLRKGLIVPESEDMRIINDSVCADGKALQHLHKGSDFYLKTCKTKV